MSERPPAVVGLCPGAHLGEFYMPLDDTEGHHVCPQCDEPLVLYRRVAPMPPAFETETLEGPFGR